MNTTLGALAESGAIELWSGYAHGGHNEAGDGIPHLRPFNVTEDGRIDLSKIKSVPAPESDSPHWLRRGDVIFNNTNSEALTGKTAFFDSDLACTASNHMTIIRVTDGSMIDSYWLASHLGYLFSTGFFRTLLRRYVGQASVSLTRLREVEIVLPSLPEQRAIARVLRTVQQAREATEQVIDAARELKRSFMRHLFTYGPVSPKEVAMLDMQQSDQGEVPADWEIRPLGDIATLQRGFDITKKEQTPGPYPVISSSGPSSTHSEFKVRGPGVLVGRKGSVGKVHFVSTDYWPHDTTLWVKDFHGHDPEFSYRLLDHFDFGPYITGVANPSINRNHVHPITIGLPPKRQQRAITRTLASVDSKIRAEAQRRDALDILFSSLLSKLMSGRLRVPESMWESAA